MQRRWMIPALFLATALVCAQTAPPKASAPDAKRSTAKRSAKRVSKKKPTAEVKVEPPPVPQPPPPTLAQQPPVAPRVSYRDGLLSIDAPNSTLSDVFAGIKRATGATVDGPTNLNDRVVVHLGPGQPRDVIASLLNGSRFDYVVMGSPQQPNGLSRILLMARQGSVEPAVRTAVAPNPPAAANRPPVANTSGDGDEEDSSDRDDSADNPPAQPVVAQPEPNQVQPNMPPEKATPPQEQNPSANPQQPNQQQQPKTPEQLYKELQNLERQRQQNPPPQPPPQ